jgi:hypothetical protein
MKDKDMRTRHRVQLERSTTTLATVQDYAGVGWHAAHAKRNRALVDRTHRYAGSTMQEPAPRKRRQRGRENDRDECRRNSGDKGDKKDNPPSILSTPPPRERI